MLKLLLIDFQAALPFSNKIEDAQVQPFVARSLALDLVPLLGWPVLEAVQLLPVAVLLPYEPGAAYAADAYVVRRECVYRAVTATTGLTIPADGLSTAEWAYQPLQTLWSQHLKAYWLHASFGRFLAQHGIDFTKAGLTQPNDPQGTFVRASSTDRATLQAAIDTTTEALRAKLTVFLRAATGYDYGHSAGACQASPTIRTRLRGINRRR